VKALPIDILLGLTQVMPSSFISDLKLSTVLQIVLQIPPAQLLQLLNEFGGIGAILGAIPPELVQVNSFTTFLCCQAKLTTY
jgi:hypothetical protein